MSDSQKNFKAPPRKYQPPGLSILYEDRDIVVVDKVSGLLTMSTDKEREQTAYFLLTEYVRRGNPKSRHRVFIVHRLDKDTSGLLVFAKSQEAKRYLQDEWAGFEKKYYAIVLGRMREKEGLITSYLAENSALKMYSVKDPTKGKLAQTKYRVVKETPRFSLLEIELLTGRKNQIRVHFADKGCPVAGDKRYGENDRSIKRLTLHAASMTINHPHSKEKMTFTAKMPEYFDSLLSSKRGKHTR